MAGGKIRYTFTAEIWKYEGPSGWYFITVPQTFAVEIRTHFKFQEEGWGRLKARALLGDCEWNTAIWFDTRINSYLLPLKKEIRLRVGITSGDVSEVTLWV